MTDFIPMTRDGYNRKRAEVARLEDEEMPKIVEKIAAARSEGDLSENAEYHAQREAQGTAAGTHQQAQVRSGPRDDRRPVQVAHRPGGVWRDRRGPRPAIWMTRRSSRWSGRGDEDYDAGKYLITSPIGQGLLGKKVGDKWTFPCPAACSSTRFSRSAFGSAAIKGWLARSGPELARLSCEHEAADPTA